MIDPALLAEDAEAQRPVPTDTALAHIAQLAAQQQTLERQLKTLEETTTATEKNLARVRERELPDAMAAVGMTEFALDDGYRVKIGDEYYANIPSADSEDQRLLDRRAECFAWLRENNSGDLIKNKIVIETGRGEEATADRVVGGLDKAGILYSRSEAVNAQTLKAFVKDRMKRGLPIPESTFGICVKRVATVAPTKKKS